MDLLEDLVNIRRISLSALLVLGTGGSLLGCLGRLLGRSWCLRHCGNVECCCSEVDPESGLCPLVKSGQLMNGDFPFTVETLCTVVHIGATRRFDPLDSNLTHSTRLIASVSFSLARKSFFVPRFDSSLTHSTRLVASVSSRQARGHGCSGKNKSYQSRRSWSSR